ncbi:hypothetical protein JCGZ_14332 [Jatropha curcas]|uniref:WRKY transcription factor 47 n=1 Tax=Jatropha curcas TaxID=180498 RepID=S5CKC4_JATCU|nr:WRKY transcription factor 22 [Jatropha curcas]AGQ04238.1 WRKY transcription factor 47 [Jatropha curcas]KDP28561.1 hypothetical protein JCGZ_14332 [Jatropha curcas]
MDDDWDLQAVVRGCTTASASASASASSSTTSTTTADSANSFNCREDFYNPQSFASETAPTGPLFSLPDPFETRNAIGELHDLYKPFFPKSHFTLYSPQSAPISSLSSFGVSNSKEQTHLKQQQQPKQSVTSSANNSHTPRSKRRKNQLKKICQVPAEALSSDVWAWRKYGQKPIKGSPYPRGYYRCSSSKGCLARKQVERNRSDPGMFILTYTGEHNHPAPTHRNSLAGSTRQKTTTPQNVTASDSNKPSPVGKPACSSPATSMDDELLPQSTNTESREEKDMIEDDEEDEFGGFSDMAVSDDFFVGLEELADPATGDHLSDHFSFNFGPPWLANNAATAASSI